ncbi:hypothetical protein BHE74_00043021 [Ensete ventricosum]|nr:hypothetical protein BHE74_00043021 [Ensete ventricosum]
MVTTPHPFHRCFSFKPSATISLPPQPQPQSHPHPRHPPLVTVAHLPYCSPRCCRNLLLIHALPCHYRPFFLSSLVCRPLLPSLPQQSPAPTIPTVAAHAPPLQCPSATRRSQPRPSSLPGRSQPHPFLSPHISLANPPDLAAIYQPTLSRA